MDARAFLSTHRQTLIELGAMIAVPAVVAGGILMAAPSAPPDTECESGLVRLIDHSLPMPKTEDARVWQWPLAIDEPAASEEIETEDEPVRRVRRHRRRG